MRWLLYWEHRIPGTQCTNREWSPVVIHYTRLINDELFWWSWLERPRMQQKLFWQRRSNAISYAVTRSNIPTKFIITTEILVQAIVPAPRTEITMSTFTSIFLRARSFLPHNSESFIVYKIFAQTRYIDADVVIAKVLQMLNSYYSTWSLIILRKHTIIFGFLSNMTLIWRE